MGANFTVIWLINHLGILILQSSKRNYVFTMCVAHLRLVLNSWGNFHLGIDRARLQFDLRSSLADTEAFLLGYEGMSIPRLSQGWQLRCALLALIV